MRGDGMDLLRRIFSAVGFDCLRRAPSSAQSPSVKQSVARATRTEDGSLSCSISLGPDPPHCQCCISYDVRLKKLACGHVFCDRCTNRIINQAFQDIEGLSDYPCPMCKSIRRLGGPVPEVGRPRTPSRTSCDLPSGATLGTLQSQVIQEEGGPKD
ncbi:hypothetical protein MATL_G00232490 [Megalops atlanticus]|uniref:RING-type domain-containing protein n=1 Tax=Megalops atlanticus TaxID=7932 RepID=A0A9D3PDQ4_MEGAT|nr:hypothetical protein MATL_G00232490 [Megalops atlanticus]